MELLQIQECPYCESIVDESRAEWDEGNHEVKCDSCNREYQVSPIYEFKGFEIQKICESCNEIEEDCFCEDE
ncbi:hypothetical protein ACQVN8_25360 [Bacillus paranthracis]|uniref:hypothetical protein n=1 Tax=Bacillus paranthracis TaxID=2026186 RepID=UPI003D652319